MKEQNLPSNWMAAQGGDNQNAKFGFLNPVTNVFYILPNLSSDAMEGLLAQLAQFS